MPKFVVGIDLGTTNSALAYAPLDGTDAEQPTIDLLGVTQVAAPGETGEFDLLPSSLYLPNANEFVEGALALPWDAQPKNIVGQFARKRGVENASRLVNSAKSWLSNPYSDPTSALLPPN